MMCGSGGVELSDVWLGGVGSGTDIVKGVVIFGGI